MHLLQNNYFNREGKIISLVGEKSQYFDKISLKKFIAQKEQ